MSASPRDPTTRSDMSQWSLAMLHRAQAGGAGGELEVRLGRLVDAGSAGALDPGGGDQPGLPAAEVTEDALGVQRVAADVHQGTAGELSDHRGSSAAGAVISIVLSTRCSVPSSPSASSDINRCISGW